MDFLARCRDIYKGWFIPIVLALLLVILGMILLRYFLGRVSNASVTVDVRFYEAVFVADSYLDVGGASLRAESKKIMLTGGSQTKIRVCVGHDRDTSRLIELTKNATLEISHETLPTIVNVDFPSGTITARRAFGVWYTRDTPRHDTTGRRLYSSYSFIVPEGSKIITTNSPSLPEMSKALDIGDECVRINLTKGYTYVESLQLGDGFTTSEFYSFFTTKIFLYGARGSAFVADTDISFPAGASLRTTGNFEIAGTPDSLFIHGNGHGEATSFTVNDKNKFPPRFSLAPRVKDQVISALISAIVSGSVSLWIFSKKK